MKRLSLALLSVTLAFGLWGQGLLTPFSGASSLESTITGGLSLNEIDSSFTVQNGFGSVGNPFFLAGVIGNPALRMNFDSMASYEMGYYQSGNLPISGFGNFSFTNRTQPIPANSSAVPTGATTVGVTSGTTTTNYTWYTTLTDSTYSLPSALNGYNIIAQGFFKISGITTGLVVQSIPNWSQTDTGLASVYYVDQISKRYYNTAAVGVAPATALNDTLETITKNINAGALPGAGASGVYNTWSTLYFGVPFAMKTGDLEHAAQLSLSFYGSDRSGNYSVTQSAYASTSYAIPGTITDEVLAVESKTSQTQIGLTYRLAMPALLTPLGGKFYAGISVIDAISGQTYTYDDITKPYTTGGAINTKTAAAGGTHDSQVDTYGTSNYLKFVAMAGHGIEIAPLPDTKIALLPTLSLAYANDGNNAYATSQGILTQRVSYTETLNSSFVNDGTTPYNKTTVAKSGSPAKTDTFQIDVQLPTSFKVKPNGWPIGFMAGATGTMDFKWNIATTSAQTTTTTLVNYTGTTVNSTTVTTTTAVPTSSSTLVTTLGETHSFGLFMPFQGGMHADFVLSNTTSIISNVSNLFDLDNMTLQLYVPLK